MPSSPLCQTLLLIFMIQTLASCVMVPVPGTGSSDKTEHLVREKLERIEVGKTTELEILELLGEPHGTFQDRERWIYRTATTDHEGMVWCAALLGAVSAVDCGRATNSSSVTYLELFFKDQLLVSKRSSKSKIGVEKTGVCFGHTGKMWLQHNSGERELPRSSGWFETPTGLSRDVLTAEDVYEEMTRGLPPE